MPPLCEFSPKAKFSLASMQPACYGVDPLPTPITTHYPTHTAINNSDSLPIAYNPAFIFTVGHMMLLIQESAFQHGPVLSTHGLQWILRHWLLLVSPEFSRNSSMCWLREREREREREKLYVRDCFRWGSYNLILGEIPVQIGN